MNCPVCKPSNESRMKVHNDGAPLWRFEWCPICGTIRDRNNFIHIPNNAKEPNMPNPTKTDNNEPYAHQFAVPVLTFGETQFTYRQHNAALMALHVADIATGKRDEMIAHINRLYQASLSVFDNSVWAYLKEQGIG